MLALAGWCFVIYKQGSSNMNLELFIARRLQYSQDGKGLSGPAVRIAVGGIATGLIVMILSIAIVIGFKSEVRNKLAGFDSHIRISGSIDPNNLQLTPMSLDSSTLSVIRGIEHVKSVQQFATQPGILKTKDDFQGIMMKGVGADYDWTFFNSNIVEGRTANISKDSICKEVLISKKTASKLGISVGEKIPIYFAIDGKMRVRPLTVCGLYATGFADFDQTVIIADIGNIRRLNNWEDGMYGGLEINIDSYDNLDYAANKVFGYVGNMYDGNSNSTYEISTIRDLNPQIFSWLDMLDTNVVIILVLMSIVAGFTIISGLLILILEKTNMIGILKSMGAADNSIRKTFLYQGCFLVGKGMIIGNIIGLAVCLLQSKYHIFSLDPEVYYVDFVPIELTAFSWILLNIGVFAISVLFLIGPSHIISKISPADAIRFE